MENKQDILEKEFEEKGFAILEKSIRAYEKLEKEYGKQYNCVVMIRQVTDKSWNTTLNSLDVPSTK